MKSILTLIMVFALLAPTVLIAADPATFEEAKQLSSNEGKPIFLEFFRED